MTPRKQQAEATKLWAVSDLPLLDGGAAPQAPGQAQEGEVQGYVLPSGQHRPQNNNPTYGEFFNALTNYIGGIVGAPLKPV